MKKVKVIIFICLIISFIVVLFYGVFGTNLSSLTLKEIKENRTLKTDLISNLKINNISAIYDKDNNIFYYMISDRYEDEIKILNIDLENDFKYKIIGETLNIIRVDYKKTFEVIIYNDKFYFETKIKLTNLPIINIESKENILEETESVFNYINVEQSQKLFSNNSKIHVRGNTSKNFDKKSYKINMYDKNYNNEKEVNISDFYYGNSFVLDALYRDPSKIRNLLSTELWNDISNDFSNIKIYSEFVELFINNEYKGLYLLTEPINRRKLNLNKSTDKDTSVVIKVQQWNDINSKLDFSNIIEDAYLGYELKYPNKKELYKKSWDKVLSQVSQYYDNKVDSSYQTISSVFNIENYIDMIIFNAFINNSDNNIDKNNYFYINSLNDNEIFIQPWDMEYTFGTRYKGTAERNLLKNMEDYNQIYTGFYHGNSPEINKLLIERYLELRKNILTKEYFDSLLNKYLNELNKGAALRDSKLWYEYDLEKEIEEIRTWIYNRIEYFDKYVESLENEKF